MTHDNDLTPEEQELFEALKAGAVMRVNEETGESAPMAHDDLPADMRECIRINRAATTCPTDGRGVYIKSPEASALFEARAVHRATCPMCLDADADSTLMDAESWREEGNEVTAAELDTEAAELRLRAAKLRAERESK
jgi:hypothetical protein